MFVRVSLCVFVDVFVCLGWSAACLFELFVCVFVPLFVCLVARRVV